MLNHTRALPGDQCEEQAIRARVSAEFREMPGLRITLAQASRLFSVEPDPCRRVLNGLVARGELSTDGRIFACADAGR
jgi:hypothetical protein